mmetsp:Transcript_4076/g.15328  ORF Transcript_4076/g.15328 Transcript_4076/m.15328 type:complete len:868 (-) Transcript_4076:107-2710(-)
MLDSSLASSNAGMPTHHPHGASSQSPALSAEETKNNFSVVIRVRPPLQRELSLPNYRNVIQCINENTIAISENHQDSTFNTHLFTFDHVYDENSTQHDVYHNTARMAVMDTMKGYNATVCAFGQTSSGKTYSLLGANGHIPISPDQSSQHVDANTPAALSAKALHDNRGIIPRATEEIFNYIQTKSSSSTKFLVRASYLQIYNDVISDLLKPERSHLKIRQDKKRGVFVENLSEWVVRSPTEIYGLLARGAQVRVEGSTRMNDKSSRSHAVFIIILEQSETNVVNERGEEVGTDIDTWKSLPKSERKGELKQVFKIGKLNLVDLAGSERQRFSGATGVRFDESKQINKSLSALGHVIKRLTSGHPKSHVPYRDSKLTRLLQDSLGGNCKTTMVINISPACFAESLSALKFANRAKTIKNKASINEDLSERALLRKYERELKKLRRELDKKSREVVDKRRLLQLEEEKRCAEEEKLAALTALEKRSREFMAEKQAKRELEKKIVMMTSNLLVGGEKIEETPQFRKLLNKEFQRVHREYANRLQEIERERQSIDEDKAQVDRYKQLLLKQRDIMIALTARLNERDETIISLQEELDVYDAHQQMLEQALDRKSHALHELQQYVTPSKSQQAQTIINELSEHNTAYEAKNQRRQQMSQESDQMQMEEMRRELDKLRSEKHQHKQENERLRSKLSQFVQGKENNSAVIHLQEENKQLQMSLQQVMNASRNRQMDTSGGANLSLQLGAYDEESKMALTKVVGSLNGDVQRMMDTIYKSVCELQDSTNMPKVVKAKSAIAELTRTMERNTNELKACVKGSSLPGNPQSILKSSNVQNGATISNIMPSAHKSRAERHVSFMTPSRSQIPSQQHQ